MDDTKNSEIEKYIHHEMTENERFLFEKKMHEDPELKEDVLLEINLHNTFNDNYTTNDTLVNDQDIIDSLKTELNSTVLRETSDFIRKSTHTFKNKKKQRTPFQLIYKITAAVAAVLLIGFMLKANLNSSTDSLYKQHANWNDLPSLIEKGEKENTLTKIEQVFDAEKYTEVIALIANNNDPYQLIYKGTSYVKLKDYQNAIQTFNKLTSTNSLESSRGYWYNFLIYLKEDNTKKAKEMLHKTLENKTNFNYKIALELIDEL